MSDVYPTIIFPPGVGDNVNPLGEGRIGDLVETNKEGGKYNM